MMRLWTETLRVTRLEASLFRRFPKLRLAAVGIVFIPALYAFIYLVSVWDPAGRTGQLPAIIVNLDRGAEAGGQHVNVGSDLTRSLQQKRNFGFREEQDPERAKREVREGRSLFVLIIPRDFSANAMSAAAPGTGKLVVYASEGNNYTGAAFAKRFAAELGHQVNETLNEQRWAAVLGATASSADALQRLRQGVQRLREGAATLDTGLGQARDGAGQLTAGAQQLSGHVGTLADGVKQLAAGARTLEARQPRAADLQALKAGAAQLVGGHDQLADGLPQLEDGARRLAEGAERLRDEGLAIPFVGTQVAGAAGQLADGAGQLREGLHAAVEGEAKLGTGAHALAQGVDQLADGFGHYAAGVSTLASRFPPDGRLDELTRGSAALVDATRQLESGLKRLDSGADQLAAGLQTLFASLPSEVPGMSGTPEGLANTVRPVFSIDAPVRNYGMGFAPNFIPVALWMGAVMTAFIFHLRRLPLAAHGAPDAALLLGKLGILGAINIAQAVVVLLMSALLLGMQPVHTAGLAITMVATSLTFMLLILALVRLFGDTGKAIALILLILQLSSAGGVVPIELTNDFFRAVSPWMPFTWSVKAVRASAFGAFGSEWGSAVGVLGLFGGAAFLLALFAGQWKFVPEEEHRPAMDI